ncbi:transcriptional regulator MmsR [Alcanivorax hongdengensis A-11-3]|uniref:Transcriptional regulator MmsR n=1 Tax=Alcanivorax hongdengensis A-11-3 TaxID=1177179 RepID=L0WBI7_9GAMM|nr:AraC family transcriptional regulator [Alcanivorax hongdengensis]EKF73437.1 transcriptional regulator MmsR [Alcanivorax hongdengensis A-11-3]
MSLRADGPAEPSSWPLPETGQRTLIPPQVLTQISDHPLCRGCMPHGVGFYPHARGHRMARQAPADDLLIYCVAGRGSATLQGREVAVSAGDLLLFPAGESHRYQADGREPWSIYWVHLGGAEVPRYFAELAGHGGPARVTVGVHSRLAEEFQALLAAATGVQSEHLVYAANLLRSLLAYAALMRHRQQVRHASLDVTRVNSYLQTRISERLSLDTLAAATSALSRYHFIREYKRQTGQTPMQAFQRMKVSRACYLLDISDLTLGDIAQQLGYDDPYYFSRLFKRVMGVAPQRYRRERGKG